MGKEAAKSKPKPIKKSARAERGSQLIREPAWLRDLGPAQRQAVADYFTHHPLAKRGR